MILYLVSIDDEYIKFGVTSQRIRMRLMQIRSQLLNHEVKLIDKFYGSPDIICGLEKSIYMMIPEINLPFKMDGGSEVRYSSDLPLIINHINEKLRTHNE